jgi:hypothetical protein
VVGVEATTPDGVRLAIYRLSNATQMVKAHA